MANISNEKQYYIYGLRDPFDGAIKYVGLTMNPESRYKQHTVAPFSRNHTQKHKWIQGLAKRNEKPEMVILDSCIGIEEARRLERHHAIKRKGDLVNSMGRLINRDYKYRKNPSIARCEHIHPQTGKRCGNMETLINGLCKVHFRISKRNA